MQGPFRITVQTQSKSKRQEPSQAVPDGTGEESPSKTHCETADTDQDSQENRLMKNMCTNNTPQLQQLRGCQLPQWPKGAHDLHSIKNGKTESQRMRTHVQVHQLD